MSVKTIPVIACDASGCREIVPILFGEDETSVRIAIAGEGKGWTYRSIGFPNKHIRVARGLDFCPEHRDAPVTGHDGPVPRTADDSPGRKPAIHAQYGPTDGDE